MKKRANQFPDIAPILARKAAGRQQQAALSFAEKIAIIDGLRARVEPIVQAREARRTSQTSSPTIGDTSLRQSRH